MTSVLTFNIFILPFLKYDDYCIFRFSGLQTFLTRTFIYNLQHKLYIYINYIYIADNCNNNLNKQAFTSIHTDTSTHTQELIQRITLILFRIYLKVFPTLFFCNYMQNSNINK